MGEYENVVSIRWNLKTGVYGAWVRSRPWFIKARLLVSEHTFFVYCTRPDQLIKASTGSAFNEPSSLSLSLSTNRRPGYRAARPAWPRSISPPCLVTCSPWCLSQRSLIPSIPNFYDFWVPVLWDFLRSASDNGGKILLLEKIENSLSEYSQLWVHIKGKLKYLFWLIFFHAW